MRWQPQHTLLAHRPPFVHQLLDYRAKDFGGKRKRQLAAHRLHLHATCEWRALVKLGQKRAHFGSEALPFASHRVGLRMALVGQGQNLRVLREQGRHFLLTPVNALVNLFQRRSKVTLHFEIGTAGLQQIGRPQGCEPCAHSVL